MQTISLNPAGRFARIIEGLLLAIGAHSRSLPGWLCLATYGRLRRLATALEGRASLIVDANQAWDETTSVRCLPVLAELGVKLVEQPLPAWDIAGMARVRALCAKPRRPAPRPATPAVTATVTVSQSHGAGQPAAATDTGSPGFKLRFTGRGGKVWA